MKNIFYLIKFKFFLILPSLLFVSSILAQESSNTDSKTVNNKQEETKQSKTIDSSQPEQTIDTRVLNPKDKEQEIKIDDKKLNTKLPIDFGVFVDGYYNANLNRPTATAQNYTTQAIQNNSFAINLAHIEGKLDAEKFRARLALQTGTSVNANYSNETTNQKYSNQNSVRNIQEAYVGIKLGKRTWIDAGIYMGNIGFEAWVSSYNWVYTRAIVLDNVPYYSTGVRISHEVTDKLSVQLHIMNGWQNITDNNKDKALGMQVAYKITDKMKFTYNNFIGNETSAPTKTDAIGTVYMYSKGLGYTRNTRYYQNFIYHYDITDRFSIAASFDIGFQIRGTAEKYNPAIPSSINPNYPYYTAHSNAYKRWYDGTLWVTYRLFPEWRISGRLERYVDREGANVPVVKQSAIFSKEPGKKPNGFEVGAISLNLDYIPNEYAMIRFEVKYRKSSDPLFDYADSADLSRHEKMFISAMTFKY
ncbi:MAG TPA: porin [Leptospiraceae bacterium]|nr:porin [Leptospiraceae bacterium]HMW06561.1 porin [Leptospiraceae bacterium]HMX32129.1 porin [Leptospiraceae bacterium]HMY31249.1 porin [Leptospiraceae bacterium]HMZ66832.1 porin [Leptospiraceae bacterium]